MFYFFNNLTELYLFDSKLVCYHNASEKVSIVDLDFV